MDARFDRVFLIPSDGSSEASLSLVGDCDKSSVWKNGSYGEEDLISLIASLGVSGDAWVTKQKQQQQQQQQRQGTVVVGGDRPKGTNGGLAGCDFSGASLVAAVRGCGDAASKGKRSVIAALKERGLPDVQQLLLYRQPSVPPPGEVQMERLSSSHRQNAAEMQSSRFCQNPNMGRFHIESMQKPKVSSRSRPPEKSFTGRGASLIGDASLTFQTALVTMLHLQKGGEDSQRKPVIPKRNLMCVALLRNGVCANRETCNYAHDLVELQKKLELRKTSLCKYWIKGKCENEDCNFAHGEHELQSTVGVFKTTICKYWRQGCCYSGAFCRHAHGEEDLRPANLPPHLERKKLLQQAREVTGRHLIPGTRRRLRCSDDGYEEGDYEGTLESIFLRQRQDANFNQIRQVLCDSGVFADYRGSLSSSAVDALLAETDEARKLRRDTEGSNSSDLSTEALLSPASGSPRMLGSAGSRSSSSLWSLASPDNSFSSGASLIPGVTGQMLPPPRSADKQASEMESFDFAGAPGLVQLRGSSPAILTTEREATPESSGSREDSNTF